MSEGRVALWSSLIFGGVHITNIFTEGPAAIGQVFVVSVSGCFFYLILRVSGTIFAAMLMHAIWDFSLFSHNIGLVDSSANARQLLPMLFNIAMAVILVVRRHHIELDAVPAPTST